MPPTAAAVLPLPQPTPVPSAAELPVAPLAELLAELLEKSGYAAFGFAAGVGLLGLGLLGLGLLGLALPRLRGVLAPAAAEVRR